MLRIDLQDSEGSTRENAIRLMYKKQSLYLFSEENDSFAVSPANAQEYGIAAIELDTETAQLGIYDPEEGSDDGFKTDLWGPLTIQGYELGNLVPAKEAASRSAIELPAFAIYSTTFSESEKQEVASLIIDGAFANK